MNPQELLLSNLETIDRAARFVARRGGLSPDDADDLAADVRLALVENDYAALRGFGGRCALGTYVASIAHRLLADERMHVRGRWRSSAESKRAGETAVLLEQLVVRDRKSIDEALPLLQALDPSMTRAAALALLERLPQRAERAQIVPLDDHVHEPEVGAATVEERLLAGDRAAAAATTNATMRDALAALSTDDRVLLRLRFGNGMRVAAIARAWQCDQQILYRRIETLVRRMQRRLLDAGIDASTAAQLIGENEAGLTFDWAESEKTPAVQTISMQGGTGSEETGP